MDILVNDNCWGLEGGIEIGFIFLLFFVFLVVFLFLLLILMLIFGSLLDLFFNILDLE